MAKCLNSQDDLPVVLFLSDYEAKMLMSMIIRFPSREFIDDVDMRPIDDVLEALHAVVVKKRREPKSANWTGWEGEAHDHAVGPI